MKRQPWQLTDEERAENTARLDAEIAAASVMQVVFSEGYQAGLDHWPPCSNPYLGIDREKARAWSQGRSSAAPGSMYARLKAEHEQQDRDWRAFIGRKANDRNE